MARIVPMAIFPQASFRVNSSDSPTPHQSPEDKGELLLYCMIGDPTAFVASPEISHPRIIVGS